MHDGHGEGLCHGCLHPKTHIHTRTQNSLLSLWMLYVVSLSCRCPKLKPPPLKLTPSSKLNLLLYTKPDTLSSFVVDAVSRDFSVQVL